jgi:hypothetical protein
MVDFRKALLLLAVLLLAGSAASAQISPFQCTANAAVTPLVRAEGLAELVGDLVLNCTGGVPTAAGLLVPKVNFRIFLNVNVTSWLLDTSGNWSESILSIDDPAPTNQNPCPQGSGVGTACAITGVGGIGLDYRAAPIGGPVYNVFQGQWISPNIVEWLGVAVDPPGTGLSRTIRITNVRANANQLGVSGTLIPSQISMFVSATGTTSIPINNPTQVVAVVQDGMEFSVVQGSTLLQCESAEASPPGVAGGPCDADVYLRFRERFATAFRERDGGAAVGGAQPLLGGPSLNTESGFFNPALPPGDHDINLAGRATQGTRFLARFNGVPSGATVRVWSAAVSSVANSCVAGSAVADGPFNSTNLAMRVNDADSVGAGGTPTTTAEWRALTLATGAGSATWEIIEAGDNPSANDTVYFAVDVVYTANTTSGIPALGTASASGSYAPISTVGTASDTAPRPRFADDSTPVNGVVINSCATSLLYPYVTNQGGFDTGLVISNTSRDPFGTATQQGACTVNYYGHTTGGGAAPAAVTTPAVPAGQHAVWTLSSGGTVQTAGGTIAAAPGFQGYVIAVCNFQYAHGYAFISDIGSGRLAQGYLALVMDAASDVLPRSGSNSEPLGN